MDKTNNPTPTNPQAPIDAIAAPATPAKDAPPAVSPPLAPRPSSAPPPPHDGASAPQASASPPAIPAKARPCPAPDEVCWRSADSLVSVVIKTWPRRRPQSRYPVLVVQLRPRDFSRIQRLDDGSMGIEALFTYEEIEQLVEATNRIGVETGKGQLYHILQRVPPKDPARKEMWDRRNANHHKRKGRGNTGSCS